LSLTPGETIKDIDGVIDMCDKAISIEIPFTIFSRFEDEPGFTGGCENAR